MKNAYGHHLKTHNESYISRLRATKPEERALWGDVVVKLLKLSLVVAENLDKLDPEEIREFDNMFRTADIVHDPITYSVEDRARAAEILDGIVDSMESRYLYLIGMTEQQFNQRKNTDLAWLNQFLSEKAKKALGPVEEPKRDFKIITSNVEPEEKETVSVQPPLMVVDNVGIEHSSELKKRLAQLLQKSYENIRLFENNFQKYSDFRHNIKDVATCFNPILRKQKVEKMTEHVAKLQRYHTAITALYNDLYQTLKFNAATATDDELDQLEYLLMVYENITLTLKNCIGDYTVSTMERRRLHLQDYIVKYNEHVDKLTSGTGDSPKSIFS